MNASAVKVAILVLFGFSCSSGSSGGYVPDPYSDLPTGSEPKCEKQHAQFAMTNSLGEAKTVNCQNGDGSPVVVTVPANSTVSQTLVSVTPIASTGGSSGGSCSTVEGVDFRWVRFYCTAKGGAIVQSNFVK